MPQQGQAEGFTDEVGLQQVCDGLVAVELGIAHPGLSLQPVPLRVAGQEDGAVRSRGLAELRAGKGRAGEAEPPPHMHTLAPTAGKRQREVKTGPPHSRQGPPSPPTFALAVLSA